MIWEASKSQEESELSRSREHGGAGSRQDGRLGEQRPALVRVGYAGETTSLPWPPQLGHSFVSPRAPQASAQVVYTSATKPVCEPRAR